MRTFVATFCSRDLRTFSAKYSGLGSRLCKLVRFLDVCICHNLNLKWNNWIHSWSSHLLTFVTWWLLFALSILRRTQILIFWCMLSWLTRCQWYHICLVSCLFNLYLFIFITWWLSFGPWEPEILITHILNQNFWCTETNAELSNTMLHLQLKIWL